MSEAPPFFSIITVVRNDAWGLARTIQSLNSQTETDREYIVIDGQSDDGSTAVLAFWAGAGIIDKSISEPDESVYDAMNKGLAKARGQYVLFMNANDIFAHDRVLENVKADLTETPHDGLLGWGELGRQIWASWAATPAFMMSSLGFCHQALYLKRERLETAPFDARRLKTDSDTFQLGTLLAQGATLKLLPEVLAIRGQDPGISADRDRTRLSILDTYATIYPELSTEDADTILSFRRWGKEPEKILRLLGDHWFEVVGRDIAYTILDTLYQRGARTLLPDQIRTLLTQSSACIDQTDTGHSDLKNLLGVQRRRADILGEMRAAHQARKSAIAEITQSDVATPHPPNTAQHAPFDVVLSTTPARMDGIHHTIHALRQQTCPPEHIHIWLHKTDGPELGKLPRNLRRAMNAQISIHVATTQVGSFGAFWHEPDIEPARPRVILGDGVLPDRQLCERLLRAHENDPAALISDRPHPRHIDGAGLFDLDAGVMCPAGFLARDEVRDPDLALETSPYDGGLWLWHCAKKRGVNIRQTDGAPMALARWDHDFQTASDDALFDRQYEKCRQKLAEREQGS